jgi:hypothetical protein
MKLYYNYQEGEKMKKFLIFIPFLLFAYEITNLKTFSTTLKPDTLKVDFTVLIIKKDLNQTLKNTQKIISLSKKCPYVDYTLEPLYEFKNKKRIFTGYQAVVIEKCKFKKTKNFDSLIKKITKYGKIRLDAIFYLSSQRKKALKTLKIKAYNFALQEAKKFSKDLNKNCILTNISFNPYVKKQNQKFKIMSTFPLPKEKQEVKVSIFYDIKCF